MNNPHPFRAACGQLKKRDRAALLRRSPEVSAHTVAEGRLTALGMVQIPSFNLRGEILWRGGPLACRAAFFPLSTAITVPRVLEPVQLFVNRAGIR
jgi:hypothetical protein